MSQLARLQLASESSNQAISAQLIVSGDQIREGIVSAELPPKKSIIIAYQNWQEAYHALVKRDSRDGNRENRVITALSIEQGTGLSGNYSTSGNCLIRAKEFIQIFNKWLCSADFIPIREALRDALSISDSEVRDSSLGAPGGESFQIQFVICTDDKQLQQLPWTQWDLLAEYPHIEISISSQDYGLKKKQIKSFPLQENQVNILAILGDSTGIDVDADRQLLNKLDQAKVEFMPTPQRSDLHHKLWNIPRDVLFFAGHSSSQGNKGSLRINAEDSSFSIDQLKNALARMVDNGLTLAIFNSCDGLELARCLADHQVPYIIVMREEVPDRVAQLFLKYFLQAFSSGVPFHQSVREARERLEAINDELPCGDWMPVIWQNPLATPPVWPQPRPEGIKPKTTSGPWKLTARQLCLGGLIVLGTTVTMLGLRWSNRLQGPEAHIYDQWIRMQPAEPVDPHILLVKVPEEELSEGKSSISDPLLERLFQQLEQAQPAIIGLYIWRDFPVESGRDKLAQYLADPTKVITVCGADGNRKSEILPSPEADPLKTGETVGLSDVLSDWDGIFRRHLLSMDNAVGACRGEHSLSTLLAGHFLDQQGLKIELDNASGVWRWGKVTIPLLQARQGPHNIEPSSGDQILVRYRNPADVRQAFESVTLSQVLNNEVSPDLIRDRIVIIGTDATSLPDPKDTPFLDAKGRRLVIPGIEYQAHQTSQLVHAGLGDRRTLRPTLIWTDVLWIGTISGLGVLICWRWRHQWPEITFANGVVILFLYGVGWVSLTSLSLVVPFVPSAFALLLSSILSTATKHWKLGATQNTSGQSDSSRKAAVISSGLE